LLLQKTQLEIDRYGCFGADTDADISALHRPIADTDIPKILYLALCFIIKIQCVFYALPPF